MYKYSIALSVSINKYESSSINCAILICPSIVDKSTLFSFSIVILLLSLYVVNIFLPLFIINIILLSFVTKDKSHFLFLKISLIEGPSIIKNERSLFINKKA